ncbi:MAG: DUF5777 family beta-barrel protein [Prolixibacteraceae bacterium]
MKKYITLIFLLAVTVILSAQNETSTSEQINEEVPYTKIEKNTFKTVLLINSPTVRNARKDQLIFIMSHRFSYLNSGFSDLFGLDNATTRFAFEYGLSEKLTLGIGRSNYKRNYDLFGKYALLRQSKGGINIPLSVSLVQSMNISSAKWPENDREYLFAHRLSYSSQLLIARKFSNKLSLQLMPTYIHRNLVVGINDQNDVLSIGAGGRYRLNSWMALTAEYYHLLPGETANNFANPLSIGLDLETSGHVFQLFFSNASAVYEAAYIAETTDRWRDGNIRFGFNISRTF